MGVALCNQADEIAHIPLLDLMDALGAPVGNDVASQELVIRRLVPIFATCSRMKVSTRSSTRSTTKRRRDCLFSSAGSRPSIRAAKIFCACALAIGRVTRP